MRPLWAACRRRRLHGNARPGSNDFSTPFSGGFFFFFAETLTERERERENTGMRLKSTSFVAMAFLATLAQGQSTPPPNGEPFFRYLGGITAIHCEHGGDGSWYLSGTRPTGWGFFILSNALPWAFYYPPVGWIFAGSVGPSTHLTKNFWAYNNAYPGTAYPPYNSHNIGEFKEVPFNDYWVQTISDDCFGVGGADE